MIKLNEFVPGGYITSPYGKRIRGKKEEFHRGYDIGTKYVPRNIFFPVLGTIHLMGESESFGNRVWVKVSNGNYYVLAHLLELSPKLHHGLVVAPSMLAGIMGSSGWSDAMHLHWEFRKDPASPETCFESEYQKTIIV